MSEAFPPRLHVILEVNTRRPIQPGASTIKHGESPAKGFEEQDAGATFGEHAAR